MKLEQTISKSLIPLVLWCAACGTGSNSLIDYNFSNQQESFFTASEFGISEPINIVQEVLLSDEQLEYIKKNMDFNILDLSAMLRVSRPTIYGWLSHKKIRKQHQKRLNIFYQISVDWVEKNVGSLAGYLHKPLGKESHSLFDLLSLENLDFPKITEYLDNLAKLIIKKKQDKINRKNLLKEYGFEPISKEERRDRLNDIDLLS